MAKPNSRKKTALIIVLIVLVVAAGLFAAYMLIPTKVIGVA